MERGGYFLWVPPPDEPREPDDEDEPRDDEPEDEPRDDEPPEDPLEPEDGLLDAPPTEPREPEDELLDEEPIRDPPELLEELPERLEDEDGLDTDGDDEPPEDGRE